VEQLVEQAVGGLGEVHVLAPGATEAREGPAHSQDPGVGGGGDVGGGGLEALGRLAQVAALGADAVVDAGATDLGTGHGGPPGSGELRGAGRQAPLPAVFN